MTRYAARQLELPGSLDEAAQLHEEIASLREGVQWRASKIDALHKQVADLQADLDLWRSGACRAEAHLSAAQTEIAVLRRALASMTLARDAWKTTAHAASALQDSGGSSPVLPPWLAAGLRWLLAMAHPDKWSQGQPATVLAHEVSCELNALRQRLECPHEEGGLMAESRSHT